MIALILMSSFICQDFRYFDESMTICVWEDRITVDKIELNKEEAARWLKTVKPSTSRLPQAKVYAETEEATKHSKKIERILRKRGFGVLRFDEWDYSGRIQG